ncbi:MAG TPA: ABC transporter permease [Candidatus Udaeobacter sp.]|nr:ABC transporter permease [Candidatus Udaeobacter sp.]
MTDLRYALRQLAKSPGFTVVAVLTLGLGIGANTAVFSFVNALLIRPLPYHAPNELVLLWEKFPAQGLARIPVSAPEYLDYAKQLQSMEVGSFNYADLNLTAGEIPERIAGAVVSPNIFSLLGVEPIRGRGFAPNEFGEGNDNVVVISERLWKRRFDSDPRIVGSELQLNGRAFTVIGIMPAQFEFPLPLFNIQGVQFGQRVDIWKPIAFTKNELESRGSRDYGVIGRLKPGVTVARAQAEIDTMISGWFKQFPDNYDPATRFGASLYVFHDQVVGGMRTALLILSGAVAVVLMIACANLATMLLARASARERELAIRVALGAGRWRLLRQMLAESMSLALGGGVFGIFLSVWGLQFLKQIGARTIPRLAEVNVDLVVLIVTALVAVGAGILFGLIPAFASAKPDLTEALKEGGRSSTTGARRNRLRNSLVVAEIALALVLLVGAGLLLKSFVRLQNVDPGFDPKNVVTMEVSLPVAKYPRGKPVSDFYAELVRRVGMLPGVEAAAITTILPLSGTNSDSSFFIEGSEPARMKVFPDEEIRIVSPDYFNVLKVPLRAGRFFDPHDNAEAPRTVIINQAFARKWLPNQDPIGRRITSDDPRRPDAKWMTIVGIVGDMRHRGLEFDAAPEFYLPHAQHAGGSGTMILAVRSKQDPRWLTTAIRNELRQLDAELPAANVRTLETVTADSIAPRRMSMVLLGAFAGIALLLASVGIYGVISYLVVQRTHEIGVRMALGAQRRDVLQMVVGHALKLVGIGAAIGLALAFLSTRALAALLYSVSSFDLTTFIFVTITLAGVALVASYIPALRAARADPVSVLSHNA